MNIGALIVNIGIWFGPLIGIIMLVKYLIERSREKRQQGAETNKKLDAIIHQLTENNK